MAQPLALTLGEPAGIGPDITLAAWHRRNELALPAFYVLGDPHSWRGARELLGLDVPIEVVAPAAASAAFATALPVVDLSIAVTAAPGRPDLSSARAAIAAIRAAVADVIAGRAAAVVTNPVAKTVLYRSGFAEPGHTEYLATLVREFTGISLPAGDDAVVAGARGRPGDHPPAAAAGHRGAVDRPRGGDRPRGRA